MYVIRNNGVARDFKFNGQRYFMGRGVHKRTEDRDFAMFMNNQRHIVVRGLEALEDMAIGALRHFAKTLGIKLARGDKAQDIRAKINTAESQNNEV